MAKQSRLPESRVSLPTENKIKIAGVGTFSPAELKAQGVKKSDLYEQFAHLPEADAKAAHEKVWAAIQGKEITEEEFPQQF